MLKNYVKIAWRNLTKNKEYSLLNIGGLAIGMACSILILLWVQNETSYDSFHENGNEIYRLTASASEDFKAAVSPAGMVADLTNELSQIENSVRLSEPFEALIEIEGEKFKEEPLFFADPSFLEVFTFPLLLGDQKTALDKPDGILLTEQTALKYFGTTQVLGEVLKIDNRDNFTVTGVLANIPSYSHLQFNAILPMSYYAKTNEDLINNVWNSFNFYGYLQFSKEAVATTSAVLEVEKKINEIYATRMPDFEIGFQLQPLKDIHLHSDLQIDLPGHGNIQYVNIFFIVAFIILIVACINYMNLATARSSRRAKEVGLRKVIGAGRQQLVRQFLGESILISFLALLLAIALVYLLLPAFNNLAQKELAFQVWDLKISLMLFSIVLITGLVAGSYPAIFLSSFKPVQVLKGKMRLAGYNLFFRNGLVIMQFVVSVLLLIGTAVIYKQLNFIKNKHLGYDKSNLVYIPMEGEIWGKQEALKAALKENPLTADFAIISDLPANLVTGDFDIHWEGKDPNAQYLFPSIRGNENFVDLFKMRLLHGRDFSKTSGENHDYLINETAAEVMGMDPEKAIGQRLTFKGEQGSIIGVVQDFNFKPLQYSIEPLVIEHRNQGSITVVRTQAGTTESTIAALEDIYSDLNPAYPLVYNFVDADIAAQYQGERQMGTIFNVFAMLAIFISCLGLYGLSAFTTEQRFKEIGIRKVLGASVLKLVNMLSRDFLKLVVIAFVVATPIAWYLMEQWLQGYTYRTEIHWWIFALAMISIMAITLVTISYQTLKVAMTSPVKSLRTE
ncbi:MAG: ABC transporter permease [Flavobacteriaceae bacterium]